MIDIDKKKDLKVLLKCFKKANIPFKQSKDGIAKINDIPVDEYFQREQLIYKMMHILYNFIVNQTEKRYKIYMNDNDFKKAYLDYLNELTIQTITSNKKSIYRISLPYLDSYNDYLDIYVIKNEDGSCTITDDGWTIRMLQDNKTLTEKDIATIKLYDIIKNEDNSLSITCYPGGNIGYCIHNLALCMLKIDSRHL